MSLLVSGVVRQSLPKASFLLKRERRDSDPLVARLERRIIQIGLAAEEQRSNVRALLRRCRNRKYLNRYKWQHDLDADARCVDDCSCATVTLNQRHRGDNPFLFSRTIVHEVAFHQDSINGAYEEAAALAVDLAEIALPQAFHHPALARRKTQLSRVWSTQAIGRFNSGVGIQMGLFYLSFRRALHRIPVSGLLSKHQYHSPKVNTPVNPTVIRLFRTMGLHERCWKEGFSLALLRCISEDGNGTKTATEMMEIAEAFDLEVNYRRRDSK